MKRIQILILILLSSTIAFAQTIPAPPYTPMPAKAYNFKGFVIVDSALKANTILTTTPAVNDSSKKVATTEWIKQQGNILYPAYSFQRSIDAGNLLDRDNEINGQSYNLKWFRNKWFNLNQKSENIGYDVENDFIQADSGTYLTYKKFDNINDVIVETNKISIGEKEIKMELNDSVKTSLLINRDSITVSIDPLNTDSSHAIATTAFVKRNSGGSGGGGSTDTTFLRRDININSAQGTANAAAIQQRIDSLRNNAGTLEARKGGVFVPQLVLPNGGGSNLNLATNYIRALNDSTIYFDSSLVITSVTGINDSTIRITKGNGATNDVQIKGGANTGGGSGITVSSYGKNASRDSTILLLSDGTRYAAKDSTGGGGGSGAAIGSVVTSATAGSILFAGTGGQLQQKNSDFFYDSTNRRLGIRTNAPVSTLEIANVPNNSNAKFGGIEFQGFSTNNSFFGDNVYYNGSDFVTRVTGFANQIYFSGGKIQFRNGTSVAAGATTPLTTALEILNNGRTIIGNTSTGVGQLTVVGGENPGDFAYPTIALGYGSTGGFSHYIHTRHSGGSGASNSIDLYTGSGTNTGTFPANAIHGITVQNGALGVNQVNPAASAVLDVVSTTKGILLPRLTTTQVNAIASPATGLTVYNTTENTLCFYNGTTWQKVTSSAL